jgi:hypothetical protein
VLSEESAKYMEVFSEMHLSSFNNYANNIIAHNLSSITSSLTLVGLHERLKLQLRCLVKVLLGLFQACDQTKGELALLKKR